MDTNDGFRKFVVRVVLFVLIGWAVALLRAVRRDRAWDDWTDAERRMEADAAARGGRLRRAACDTASVPCTQTNNEHGARRCLLRSRVVHRGGWRHGRQGIRSRALRGVDAGHRRGRVRLRRHDDRRGCSRSDAAFPDPAAAAPEAAEPAQPAEQATEVPAELAGDLAASEAGADLEPASTRTDRLRPSRRRPRQRTHPQQLPLQAPAAGPESYVLAPEESDAAAEPARSDTRHWVVKRAKESKVAAPAVEDEGGAPTVWLNRALPDPTPPAKRLSPAFAKNLQRISGNNGVKLP